jgi:Family of unknown function (DUF6600)
MARSASTPTRSGTRRRGKKKKKKEHPMKTNLKRRLLLSNRLARAVLIAGLAFTATTLLPATSTFAVAPATTAASPASSVETLAEFRAVLVKYGTFGRHEKYGEIWVPTVTPQGWHPYPACQWVYTKDGWYFNDETEWGAIIHAVSFSIELLVICSLTISPAISATPMPMQMPSLVPIRKLGRKRKTRMQPSRSGQQQLDGRL